MFSRVQSPWLVLLSVFLSWSLQAQVPSAATRPQWTVPIAMELLHANSNGLHALQANTVISLDPHASTVVRFTVQVQAGDLVTWNLSTPEGNQEFSGDASIEVPLLLPGTYAMTVAVSTVPNPSAAVSTSYGLAHFGATWNPVVLNPQSIGAPISMGGQIVVAVLDTGVNYNHPDLQQRLATNAGEIAFDGMDNDQNGFIDDALGWDFVNNDQWPADDTGHGTLIAGIAAREPAVRILPVKVTSALHVTLGENVAAGIYYALANGAKILILSFGSFDPEFRNQIMPALKEAERVGALLVVAAGNQHTDIDQHPRYPASITMPNLISVAAVNRAGQLSVFSNYGAKSVAVAAYGGDATATDLGPEGPSYLSQGVPGTVRHIGTSFAAPVVAALAAHFWCDNPGATVQQVRAHLIGDQIEGITHL